MNEAPGPGLAGRMAGAFLDSKLTPLLVLAAMLVGALAVWRLPREEEPQISVPMIDVFVTLPGAGAEEVESRITRPLEQLAAEVPGVEYVYSSSAPGRALVIVRFEVGEPVERATVRLNDKLRAAADRLPEGASPPLLKPRSIDDVPVLALTLFSRRLDGFALRRVAAELAARIRQVPRTSAVEIIGGERRELRIVPDPERLAVRGLGPLAVVEALAAANRVVRAGAFSAQDREYRLEAGSRLADASDAARVVVTAAGGRPVFLGDVAEVRDGPAEPVSFVEHGEGHELWPAVTLAVAKRPGTNAVEVVREVLERVEQARGWMLPSDVEVAVTRDYGETARHKSDELLFHMLLAVAGVSLLIGVALGRREAAVVLFAIPATLALTLAVFYFLGYTLNRITLFALIFSIGILVDDAIVVVENITRHFQLASKRGRPAAAIAVEAVDEVGNPTLLATLTVIAAILPLAFVGGLMGPYMRPIPIGSAAAMAFSLVIAFAVTPWATLRLIGRDGAAGHAAAESAATRLYRRVMGALIAGGRARAAFLALVVVLLVLAVALVPLGWVEVKMLPFDDKSEFQVIVNLPEGTPLERTREVARALGREVARHPDVRSYELYAGSAAPFNFNGLVRHYYLRSAPHQADLQVKLAPRGERGRPSHDIAVEVRRSLAPLAARLGARIQVAEVPPGPPVLQTLVAEIYGPDPDRRLEIARQVRRLLEATPGVVDVDWYVEADAPLYRLHVDREKAALAGLTAAEVATSVRTATEGQPAGRLYAPREREDVPIVVRLDRAVRSDLDRLRRLPVGGRAGPPVALGELVSVELRDTDDRTLYRKNQLPVTYVTADVAGEIESPVYAVLALAPGLKAIRTPDGRPIEVRTASPPADARAFALKWDGEWHITYEVFRDLGIAFAAVLVLIYVLVVGWFRSFSTPVVIMSAIPFSLVGILPAHGALGAFFTATSMIGFIAGAGIVVRNSIILVDFIELRLREGMPLAEAVVDAGAVRFRPMLLTAAAVIAGAGVILFDPIFQGLAISLMAGEVASLLLSRMTVPVVYYLAARWREGRTGAVRPV